MRKERLGTYKLGNLIADLREGPLKQHTQEYIQDELLKKYFNEALYEYYDLGGAKDTDEYSDTVQVPIIEKVVANASTGSSYVSATRTLTLPVEDDNITWENCEGFNDNWVGNRITITDTSTDTDYLVTIESYQGTSGGFTMVSITDEVVVPNIAEADLLVQGQTSADMEADDIDLTKYIYFKRIDHIVRMVSLPDTGRKVKTAGQCIGPPVISNRNFDAIKISMKGGYSNFKYNVIWLREGEKLRRAIGSGLTTYGICKITVTLLPAKMDDMEDLLDCKDTSKPTIDRISRIKAVQSLTKEQITTPISAEDISWYQELTGSKQAKAEEKA